MQKNIVSRHPIASGGRHRVQKGSIVVVLECKHAVLGTQSEHGVAKRAECALCAAAGDNLAQDRIAALEAQLQKLKQEFSKAPAPAYQPREDRQHLKEQLLALMEAGPCTSIDMAEALNADRGTVGKTLHNMMQRGKCVQVGKTPDGLNLWSITGAAQ